MAIKKSSGKLVYDLSTEFVVEELFLKGAVDNWEFSLTHTQHQTWVNGETAEKLHIVLHIFFKNGGLRYQGSISFNAGADWYVPNYWYKVNDQRERSIEFEKVKPTVDKIFVFYHSNEGQSAMYRQTLDKLDAEINELEDRMELNSKHRIDLIQHLRGLNG